MSLFPHDLSYLGGIYNDFEYTAKSAVHIQVNKRQAVRRPKISCDSARITEIKVSLELSLCNIYMPTDCKENLPEYTNCLSKLSAIVESNDVETMYILGDFNSLPGEIFAMEFFNFCSEHEW